MDLLYGEGLSTRRAAIPAGKQGKPEHGSGSLLILQLHECVPDALDGAWVQAGGNGLHAVLHLQAHNLQASKIVQKTQSWTSKREEQGAMKGHGPERWPPRLKLYIAWMCHRHAHAHPRHMPAKQLWSHADGLSLVIQQKSVLLAGALHVQQWKQQLRSNMQR